MEVQSPNKKMQLPGNYEGLFNFSLGCWAVYSIIHAFTHVGISSFMGWVALVSVLSLFYSNSISRFSEGRELLLKQQTSFVGQILLGVIFAVQITAAAGVWDAR